MQKPKCTHIRIRDDNDYNLDVEALIKSIQKQFNIDFRSLPEWQELVKRLHVSQTDYKRRVQYANLQKATIIDKLYIQFFKPSPFQLTEELARTASKWQRMKEELKNAKIGYKATLVETINEASEEAREEEIENVHPNTEIGPSDSSLAEPSKVDVAMQPQPTTTIQSLPSMPATGMPILICTNSHKLISPLDSKTSNLSCHSVMDYKTLVKDSEAEATEWQPSTSAVVCNPTPINVEHNTLDEQCLLFSLINCTGEYLHIRFKYVTDDSPFIQAKILPKIPKRLYPGIAVVFKLVFKLKNEQAFHSGLYFRIGRDVYANEPTKPFFIPIVCTFGLNRVVTVSDTVTIPSVYPYHIKTEPDSEYPTGIVKITVDDPYSYHLHIHERRIDLSSESDIFMSMQASTLNTESMEDRDTFIHSETDFPVESVIPSKSSVKSNALPKFKSATKHKQIDNIKAVESEGKEINVTEDMSTIVKDIVQLALDPFVFNSTYMYLQPQSKRTVNVYFTKAENIGYHQRYYDFEFIDPDTETVVIKKSIKVFAEVLPHPIQVKPIILDMSNSRPLHGYYADKFIVSNTHRVFPFTAYIKLTTKMKKLFYVIPMKSVVPARSSVTFEVKFCARHYLSPSLADDLVHFTFKIVVVGYKTVYHHVPPIFYELIAPCAAEFKQVYSEKYFKETIE